MGLCESPLCSNGTGPRCTRPLVANGGEGIGMLKYEACFGLPPARGGGRARPDDDAAGLDCQTSGEGQPRLSAWLLRRRANPTQNMSIPLTDPFMDIGKKAEN